MLQIFLLNLAITGTASDMQPYIVGGHQDTIKNWPFIAFVEILESETYLGSCGGSLISSQTVLTAAHCLDDMTNKKTNPRISFRIYMGHSSFKRASLSRVVFNYETHKKYSPLDDDANHDIGIMFLARPVQFSANVQKVILQHSFNSKKDKLLEVAGWGNTDKDGDNGISSRLKSLILTTKKYKMCANMHKVICTATNDKEFPFTGDSGGPIVNADTHYQVGIVSVRDMQTGISVFTSVPEYWSWIKKTQKRLFKNVCKKEGK